MGPGLAKRHAQARKFSDAKEIRNLTACIQKRQKITCLIQILAKEAPMGRKRGGVPGLSFSWKRALGISSAKAKLSRQLGVPLTRSGRQRKVGRAVGCVIAFAFILTGFTATGVGAVRLVSALLA